MSDGMKNYFNKKYPGTSFTTLVHGFELPESNRLISTDKKNKIVRFLFTGSLNESCRDATIRMMKVILSKEEYELHVYSGNPKSDFEKYGISGKRFFYHGFISLSELYENMNNYDIMLLPHGLNGKRTDVEFKTIFPTRTIPLLVSGKPILAHAPKDTFLTEFLEYHNCAWIVNEANEFKLLDTINQILVREDETNLKIQNALRVSEMFKIENVLVKLRTEIE